MLNGLKGIIISMLTVFKHLFMKAVTLEYPEKRFVLPENFRGKPCVNGCIKCGTCIKVCPSGAIEITGNEFKIDLKKCIFCGNCSYYCPVSAIKMSKEYELASQNKQDLELVYNIGEEKNA